jgi:hypothetical protein
VATAVIVPVQTFLPADGEAIFKEPLERQKKVCDPLAESPVSPQSNNSELSIFPETEDSSQTLGLGVPKSEIESRKSLTTLPGKHILPIVVGCVDYQFGNSLHHHQTRFIYEIQSVDPDRPPHIFSLMVGGSYPAERVAIIKYPFGGFQAF